MEWGVKIYISQIIRRSLTYEVFIVVKVRVVEYPTVPLVEPADPALPTNWAVCHRHAPDDAGVHRTEIREQPNQELTYLPLDAGTRPSSARGRCSSGCEQSPLG